MCAGACVCLKRRGRAQELGDLHLYTVSHTLRSMLVLGGSSMCTLNLLYIQCSLSGGTAMASRCPSIFREHTLTGELPSVHQGCCPSLMLTTFLAINLTHKWNQTTATCTKLRRRLVNLHVQPDTLARHMHRCTRLEIYARVSRRSPTSWGEALSLSFSRHPQDQVLHHVEESVSLLFPLLPEP